MSEAHAVLARLREIERLLPIPNELGRAQAVLKAAEDALSLSAGHSEDCDRWCRVWMLLFGAWQSLRYASLFSDALPLIGRLRLAHSFSRAHIDSTEVEDDYATGWYAGYFLISAEYRIAGGLDRATKLFCSDNPAEDLRIHDRCWWLLKSCPQCRDPDYLRDAKDVLATFRRDTGQLFQVWKRVNALKHGGNKAVSSDTSLDRFRQAANALGDVALVFCRLVEHKKSCPPDRRAV